MNVFYYKLSQLVPVFEERLAQCLKLDNIQNSCFIQGHMRMPHSLSLLD